MSKHVFVPTNIPLYANYRSKVGDESVEDFTLPIVGFDVEYKDDDTFFAVPLDLNIDGMIEEVPFCTKVHDITVSYQAEYK